MQRGGTDFLFGHRHFAPRKGFVRQALGTAGRHLGHLHQQHAQALEMAGGQLAHRAGINFLLRGPQVFAHGGGQLSKALCRQLGTKGGGALAAARQKERRLALHALGHRVAGAAMGRDELPVLPGAAQRGREHLHAGKAGQHHS